MITLISKLKLPIIFPYPFNEFYDILRDSFNDMVHKYVDDISLTDEEIKDIEYFTRGERSSNLRWE